MSGIDEHDWARHDQAVVDATGLLTEALEWIERARGRLFDFHHLIGRADFLAEDAADALERAGHPEAAQRVRDELVGRNVLDGRWTFQVVEEFDRIYYGAVKTVERELRDALVDGVPHLHEARLKHERRSRGRPGHEAEPPARREVASP